tara:strand:- start:27 stop:1313 length:1287 start_codon:yes stop_codon:yes gene_type:complete
MFKKLMMGLLLTTSLLSQNIVGDFFKYSTAYASFSLNAPRYQDDRFAIIGGLSTGQLEISRDKRELKPDFQTSFGLRKIGRFQYEPKRGVKSAGRGGTWYDGSEQNANESATFGPVKGWEYLVKLSEGRQWGNDYVNREFWLRYIGDYLMAKVGVTELGLEDIKYTQGDVRLHLTPEALNDKFHLSVGVKHRQHPVYGFDAMVLDTTWYRGEWWKFAEKAFGIDDNAWFTQEYYENGDLDVQLYELDPETGELRPIEGGGPFWNDDGRFVGVDWLWRDVDGRIFAYTDREYFLYHFPGMLEQYIDGVKRGLGSQNETSLVLGIDFYHYDENWWLHTWGNWLPYHYGHTTHAYHNAAHYRKHKDDGGKPHEFMFMDKMWHSWNDYDMGAIFGVKIKDNLGVFAEGRYLYYWERPAYDIKLGINYQFMGW